MTQSTFYEIIYAELTTQQLLIPFICYSLEYLQGLGTVDLLLHDSSLRGSIQLVLVERSRVFLVTALFLWNSIFPEIRVAPTQL